MAKKQEKKTTKKQVDKSRYFTFLLYPDSLPKDWRTKLQNGISEPMAVSPLHNMDIMKVDENGVIHYKKPHYHVMYVAKNSVTAGSVAKKVKRHLGNESVALVKIVDNCENLYNYLTHDTEDARKKNKHQYPKSGIVHLNNFDIARYIAISKEDNDEFVNDLFDFIIDNNIKNAVELREVVGRGELNRERTYRAMRSAVSFINMAFNGVYQNDKKNIKRQHDRIEEYD